MVSPTRSEASTRSVAQSTNGTSTTLHYPIVTEPASRRRGSRMSREGLRDTIRRTKEFLGLGEDQQGDQEEDPTFPAWQGGQRGGRGGAGGRGRGRGGSDRGRGGRGGGRNGFNKDKTYRRCYNCVDGCSREGCTIPHIQPCQHAKDPTAKYSSCACPCSNHLAHLCKHLPKEKKSPGEQPAAGAAVGAPAAVGAGPGLQYTGPSMITFSQEEQEWRRALGCRGCSSATLDRAITRASW